MIVLPLLVTISLSRNTELESGWLIHPDRPPAYFHPAAALPVILPDVNLVCCP